MNKFLIWTLLNNILFTIRLIQKKNSVTNLSRFLFSKPIDRNFLARNAIPEKEAVNSVVPGKKQIRFQTKS